MGSLPKVSVSDPHQLQHTDIENKVAQVSALEVPQMSSEQQGIRLRSLTPDCFNHHHHHQKIGPDISLLL